MATPRSAMSPRSISSASVRSTATADPLIPAPSYLSSKSASALISEFRPTILSPQSLAYLNEFLDEILSSLIAYADSIDPVDIKLRGVPAVFTAVTSAPATITEFEEISPKTPSSSTFGRTTSILPEDGSSIKHNGKHRRIPSSTSARAIFARNNASTSNANPLAAASSTHEAGSKALGRDAIHEAEVELRAWREGKKNASLESIIREDAFEEDLKGMKPGMEVQRSFPVGEAIGLMRCRAMAYSTLASQPPDYQVDKAVLSAWDDAGGSTADDILSPASLYLTAILEHICERVLTKIGRVMARNTSSSSVGVDDLYAALCENETVFGLYKGMRVRDRMEADLGKGKHPVNAAKFARIPVSQAAEQASAVSLINRSETPPITITSAGIAGPGPSIARSLSIDSHSTPAHSLRAALTGHRKPPPSSLVSRRLLKKPSKSSLGLNQGHQRSVSSTVPTDGGARLSMDTNGDQARAGSVNGLPIEGKSVRDDDFDALLNSGQTLKVSLTPGRLKNFDRVALSSTTPGPSRSPPVKSTSPIIDSGLPLRSGAASPNPSLSQRLRDSHKRNRSTGSSVNGSGSMPKLTPREAGGRDVNEEEIEDDDEVEEPPGSPPSRRKGSESLVDFIRNGPPEPAASIAPDANTPSVSQTSHASATVVALAPALATFHPQTKDGGESNASGSSSPSSAESATASGREEAVPGFTANGRPIRVIEDTASDDADHDMHGTTVRKRSSAAELADFLLHTAPPSQPERQYPGTERRRSSGNKKVVAKRSSAAELADFLNNTPPPAQRDDRVDDLHGPASGRQSRLKTLVAKIARRGSDDTADSQVPIPRGYLSTANAIDAQLMSRRTAGTSPIMASAVTQAKPSRLGAYPDVPASGHSPDPLITHDVQVSAWESSNTDRSGGHAGSPTHDAAPPYEAGPNVAMPAGRQGRSSAGNGHAALDSVDIGSVSDSDARSAKQPMTRHQVLIWDVDLHDGAPEPAIARLLRVALSPYYTVQCVNTALLEGEPWTSACALLVMTGRSPQEHRDIAARGRLKAKMQEYLRTGGSLWGIGAVCRYLCRDGTEGPKLLSEETLFPGLYVSASNLQPNRSELHSSVSGSLRLKAGAGFASFGKGDLASGSYCRTFVMADVGDRDGGRLAVGWPRSRGMTVLWAVDLIDSVEADKPVMDRILHQALAFLGMQHINLPSAALTCSRWSSVDQTLLTPKHPSPLFLLSHPDLPEDLSRKVLAEEDIAVNYTLGTEEMDGWEIEVHTLADNNNTFHVVNLPQSHFPVENYLEAERRRKEEVQEPGVRQASLPLFTAATIGAANSWSIDWTPLFDFRLYWSELSRWAKKRGVYRSRADYNADTHLGGWNVGDVVQYGEAVTSTQTMLDRNPLLLYGLPVPYVSLASFQLAGRGRGKNQWLSPPGCLQFSMLLRLPRGFPAAKLVFVQYLAALAICQGLDEEGKLGIKIKWPNDLYAEAEGLPSGQALDEATDKFVERRKGRAKIGGVLVNSSCVKGEWHLVVGCGINMLNDLPTTSVAQLYELAEQRTGSPGPRASSLSMESSLAAILVAFEDIWRQFVEERGFESFIDEYLGRWLHSEQTVTLTTVSPAIPLVIKTITLDNGLLRCLPAEDENDWMARYNGGGDDRYAQSTSNASRYVDLQPDGNSFDMMSGLIKKKT